MTAFCFWNTKGKSLYHEERPQAPVNLHGEGGDGTAGCELDGVLFHCIDVQLIPLGYASVPVKADEGPKGKHGTIMLAGSVGVRVTSSGDELEPSPRLQHMGELESDSETERKGKEHREQQPRTGPDTIQTESGCWIFEKKKTTMTRSAKTHGSLAPTSDCPACGYLEYYIAQLRPLCQFKWSRSEVNNKNMVYG